MNICICFWFPLKMVGASPTNFLLCPCGMAIGGGPHPLPGSPVPGGPPPPPQYPPPLGNPPPPPGNPPPLRSPPLGNPLPGQSSCGSLIGGSSGNNSGPLLGGSALSGLVVHLNTASSSTMLATHSC